MVLTQQNIHISNVPGATLCGATEGRLPEFHRGYFTTDLLLSDFPSLTAVMKKEREKLLTLPEALLVPSLPSAASMQIRALQLTRSILRSSIVAISQSKRKEFGWNANRVQSESRTVYEGCEGFVECRLETHRS